MLVVLVPVDVGTFLLNEKRPEIHGIETRFKVNVLLVPNRYLETPNYTGMCGNSPDFPGAGRTCRGKAESVAESGGRVPAVTLG